MVSWKEKVSEKFSHLFSHSSTSQSPVLDQSRARPHPKESKPLSSIFSLILPSSGFDGTKSIKDGNDAEPIQSSPVKWKGTSMSWQDKPLDCNEKCDNNSRESRVTRNSCEDSQQCETGRSYESERMGASSSHEDGDPGSGRSTSSSEIFEDATDRHNIEKYMPYLTEESSFVYPELYECLVSSLPNIVKGCQWVLLYSTIKHGISLRTLIRRSADLPGPCLLIVGDKQGAVFGGLLQSPLKPTPKRKYQGTNQTFVFTNIYGGPRLFRPTGANRFFYMCVNELLALGGGGNYALCLNEDLLTGTSGPCETFGNLCLAHNEEFELKNVELWGFTHASRYHS